MISHFLYIIFSFIVSTIFPSSSFESTLKSQWDSDFYQKKLVEVQRKFCDFVFFCGRTLLLNDDKVNDFKNGYNKIKDKDTYSDDDVKQMYLLYTELVENIETIKTSIKKKYDLQQETIENLTKLNFQCNEKYTQLLEDNTTLRKQLREKDNSVEITVMNTKMDLLERQNSENEKQLEFKSRKIAELEQKVLNLENNTSTKIKDNQIADLKKEITDLKNQSTQSSFFKKSFLFIVTIIFSIVLWEKKSVFFAKIF